MRLGLIQRPMPDIPPVIHSLELNLADRLISPVQRIGKRIPRSRHAQYPATAGTHLPATERFAAAELVCVKTLFQIN